MTSKELARLESKQWRKHGRRERYPVELANECLEALRKATSK